MRRGEAPDDPAPVRRGSDGRGGGVGQRVDLRRRVRREAEGSDDVDVLRDDVRGLVRLVRLEDERVDALEHPLLQRQRDRRSNGSVRWWCADRGDERGVDVAKVLRVDEDRQASAILFVERVYAKPSRRVASGRLSTSR